MWDLKAALQNRPLFTMLHHSCFTHKDDAKTNTIHSTHPFNALLSSQNDKHWKLYISDDMSFSCFPLKSAKSVSWHVLVLINFTHSIALNMATLTYQPAFKG